MTCGLGCFLFLGSDSVVDSLLIVAPVLSSMFVLWFVMHCFVSSFSIHLDGEEKKKHFLY